MKDYENRVQIIIDMWDEHTLKEIGERIGVKKQRIYQIVAKLRKFGLPVPLKRCPTIDWQKIIERNKDKFK